MNDTENSTEKPILQRALKFRAWDPEAREMVDEWVISQDYNYAVPDEPTAGASEASVFGTRLNVHW